MRNFESERRIKQNEVRVKVKLYTFLKNTN